MQRSGANIHINPMYGPDKRFNLAVREYLSGRQIEMHKYLAKNLIAYFRGLCLRKITPRRIGWYRVHRLSSGAARSTVNREVWLLLHVLAGADLHPRVRPLRDDPRPRRRLLTVEFDHLAAVAATQPQWIRPRVMASLAAATGLGKRELAQLQWSHIDPFRRVLSFRDKEFPLTKHAIEALVALEEIRMYAPGKCRPSDKIADWRSWWDAWRSMVKAAGLKGLSLKDVQSTHGKD